MRRHMESGDLELGLLRTFLAVAECGSMGRTAAVIDRTQPAISAQVLRLEKIVGHKLFSRSRYGVKLTRHGELLTAYANRFVDLSAEALKRLRGEKTGRRLALGMSTDVVLVGLGSAIRNLQSIHPDLELKIVVTAPDRLDGLLKSRQIDLAIGDPSLIADKPSAAWPVSLDWAASKELSIDPSRAIPLVLFESPCSWQDEMLNALRAAGWEWRTTFESACLDAILTAVQSGLGIAALPTETIRKYKLNLMHGIKLPPAPKIQFALFENAVLPNETRRMLTTALDSMFRSDTEVLVA